MPQDQNNLIWLDMEMTGLNPDADRVIEVAIVITDSQLVTVAEAPVLVVHQSDAALAAMDDWNKGTHGRSGLRHVLIGGTAERIVQHAPCPVLVVKNPEKDFVVA